MAVDRKPSVSIKFPGVPEPIGPCDVVVAMGRLAIGWSSSEYYLALILARLMAQADLSSRDKIQKAASGRADMIVDMNAVYALYFAVESSRGRRKMVMDLASVRNGEGYLTQSSFEEIKSLLEKHSDIGRVRNKYAHTAMGRIDDGAYVLLDGQMLISRTDGSRKQRSAKIRANNNKVQAKAINEVADRLAAWVGEATDVLNRISTLVSPSLPPPTKSER